MARIVRQIYEKTIRAQVEADQNIGKMVIIDVTNGHFLVDDSAQ